MSVSHWLTGSLELATVRGREPFQRSRRSRYLFGNVAPRMPACCSPVRGCPRCGGVGVPRSTRPLNAHAARAWQRSGIMEQSYSARALFCQTIQTQVAPVRRILAQRQMEDTAGSAPMEWIWRAVEASRAIAEPSEVSVAAGSRPFRGAARTQLQWPSRPPCLPRRRDYVSHMDRPVPVRPMARRQSSQLSDREVVPFDKCQLPVPRCGRRRRRPHHDCIVHPPMAGSAPTVVHWSPRTPGPMLSAETE